MQKAILAKDYGVKSVFGHQFKLKKIYNLLKIR